MTSLSSLRCGCAYFTAALASNRTCRQLLLSRARCPALCARLLSRGTGTIAYDAGRLRIVVSPAEPFQHERMVTSTARRRDPAPMANQASPEVLLRCPSLPNWCSPRRASDKVGDSRLGCAKTLAAFISGESEYTFFHPHLDTYTHSLYSMLQLIFALTLLSRLAAAQTVSAHLPER